MGASTSVNNQTFNISGNNNTLTSIPKISSSLTVPVDVTSGMNPVYYQNLDDISILADLTTANFLASVSDIDFGTLIPTEEEIISATELNQQLRLFGITPGSFRGLFKGFSSINVNTITSFSKGLANILNVISNTSERSSGLKDFATKVAPHAGKFLRDLWDKRAGSRSDDLSRVNEASATVIPSEEMNKTTELLTNNVIAMNRLITLTNADSNALHDVTIGNDRPNLQIMSDGSPVSKTDAILSNQLLVPFSDTVNALSSIAAGSVLAENKEITAKSVAACVSSSSPNITVTPTNRELTLAVNRLPITSRDNIRETVALAGSIYGISIDNQENKAGSSNTLQDLIDGTPIPGRQGMTLRNVSMMKRNYFKDFENYDIEVMISNPEKINLTDAPNITFISNQHWLEVFSAVTTNRISEVVDRFYVNNNSMSVKIPNRTIFTEVLSVDPNIGVKVAPLFIHDYNFHIDDIYDDYNGVVTMVLSFYTNSVVNGARSKLYPGLFVVPKGMTEVVFLPGRPIDSGRTSFRLSFNTANVTRKANIFGTQALFTFGVASHLSAQVDIRAGTPLFTFEISDATVNLSRTTSLSSLGHWIYNREKSSDPLLCHVDSIHPGILESRAPNDVNVFWQRFCSKYTPYLNTMVNILGKQDYDIFYASLGNSLRPIWDTLRDPQLPNKYNLENIISIRTFCIDAVLSMSNWMYYSSENVFDYIKPDYRVKIAWRMLTMVRSLIPVCIYNTSSAQTILSAWENISKVTDPDVTNTLTVPTLSSRIKLTQLPPFQSEARSTQNISSSFLALSYDSRTIPDL